MYEKVRGKHYSVVDFKIIYEKSKTYINPIKPRKGGYICPRLGKLLTAQKR